MRGLKYFYLSQFWNTVAWKLFLDKMTHYFARQLRRLRLRAVHFTAYKFSEIAVYCLFTTRKLTTSNYAIKDIQHECTYEFWRGRV